MADPNTLGSTFFCGVGGLRLPVFCTRKVLTINRNDTGTQTVKQPCDTHSYCFLFLFLQLESKHKKRVEPECVRVYYFLASCTSDYRLSLAPTSDTSILIPLSNYFKLDIWCLLPFINALQPFLK